MVWIQTNLTILELQNLPNLPINVRTVWCLNPNPNLFTSKCQDTSGIKKIKPLPLGRDLSNEHSYGNRPANFCGSGSNKLRVCDIQVIFICVHGVLFFLKKKKRLLNSKPCLVKEKLLKPEDFLKKIDRTDKNHLTA